MYVSHYIFEMGVGLGVLGLWRELTVGEVERPGLDAVPEGGVVHADARQVGVRVGVLGLVAHGDDVGGEELGFCVCVKVM